jgi:hypothetical protein
VKETEMAHIRQRSTLAALVVGLVMVLGGVLVASLALLGSAEGDTTGGGDGAPAKVEHVDGSDLARITLTEQAGQRIDVQTAAVRGARVGGAGRIVVPYSSLLYDAEGATWVYTSPEALVFERTSVTVDEIRGERVFLSAGPPRGTSVVTVGATELWGSEFGVGH